MATSVRLCLSQSRTPEGTLADHIHTASEAGFSALDLWAPKLDDYLDTYPVIWLDMELQKHHVYVMSVSGIELFSEHTQEDVPVHEAHFLERCTHLDTLGGGTIVVRPGAGLEGEEDGTRAVLWTVYALRSYSALAAPFEVRIALESPASACPATSTLAASQEIVRQVAHGNVGLALNIGQLHAGGGGLEDVEMLDVERLWLVRLESRDGGHSFTQLQHTVCKQLAAKGFRGPFCVEWPTPASASQTDAAQGSLIERARQARQEALELLTPLYA